MLRKDIRRAADNVLQALKAPGMDAIFKIIVGSPDRDIDRSKFLAVFAEYLIRFEKFGEAEKRLIAILDLSMLHDPVFWSALMTAEQLSTPTNYALVHSVRFAREQLPKVLSLLARESDQIPEPTKKGKEPKENALSQLSVTVIEERQQSTPERLVLALQSIDGLYRACAQFLDESEGGLSVIACDSGSDKSFDFLGVAKIVECVKQVILSFWDKVVYYREDKTKRRLELVAQSLPILDEIASMKESGKLEPERAELIKRQVIESVTKFAAAGLTIPEIENFTVYDPRQLMKPEPKLLVAPKQAGREAGKGEEESKEAELPQIDDPEFQVHMANMARKFLEGIARSTDASKAEQAEGPDDESGTATDSGEG